MVDRLVSQEPWYLNRIEDQCGLITRGRGGQDLCFQLKNTVSSVESPGLPKCPIEESEAGLGGKL